MYAVPCSVNNSADGEQYKQSRAHQDLELLACYANQLLKTGIQSNTKRQNTLHYIQTLITKHSVK